MRRRLRIVFAFVAASVIATAGESLLQETFRAVAKGDFKHAYSLWAQPPVHSSALPLTAAQLEVAAAVPPLVIALPPLLLGVEPPALEPPAIAEIDTGSMDANGTGTMIGSISDNDLLEARGFARPMRLKPFAGTRSFHLHGDVKTLYESVAKEFGYEAILERDLKNAPATTLRFDIENANYQDALHLLEAATNTFIVPVSQTVLLAAIDTQQKRNELEPSAAQMILIPQRSSVQEAQELLQAVQQSLEVKRAVLDPGKRMILMRGPYSRVRVAAAVLQQLLGYKPQVSIEVELITFAKSKSRSWGLGLMTSSNLVNFGQGPTSGVTFQNPSSITNFLTFGGGSTFMGIGFTGATLFANATESEATSLMRSTITVVDGQAANFHIGDKYPIPTAQFSGLTVGGIGAAPPVNFEDLGIVMKVTPSIHSTDEVSLDLEAEFKALGTTTSNGIPTISDKKLQAKVRLNTSDWVVVAGLVSRSDTVTLNGIPGLSTLPVIGGLFRSNMKATDFSEALVLVKVNVMSMPADEDKVTRALWVGSDTRWRTVL
jgi:general secretion pathway protein D